MIRKIKRFLVVVAVVVVLAIMSSSNVYAAPSSILELSYLDGSGGSAVSSPVVGRTYSGYLSNKPINSTFGTATRKQSGVGTTVKKVTRKGWWVWDKTEKSFTDKVFVVYKFPKRLNLRIERLSEGYYYVSAGLSKTSTYYKEKGYSYTYEKSVGTELAAKLAMNAELSVGGIKYYGAELGGKLSGTAEIQGKISASITETTSYTYKESVTDSFTIDASTSSYYSYEKRGAFDLYVCQVYQVNYSQTKTKRDQWYEEYDYTYTVTGYKLLEQQAKLTYVDDTLEIGYYKYNKDSNGNYYYADTKVSNMVYY